LNTCALCGQLSHRHSQDFFACNRALVDSELNRLIPSETHEPVRLHRAIRWSVFAGGKRFRPALLIATGEAFGAAPEQLLRTGCAFEMIHTYSLIHDDLPSMDNDDLRRGQPTCHVKFDEATAILAGDALQALAFQTIAEDEQLSPEIRVRVAAELARGAGHARGNGFRPGARSRSGIANDQRKSARSKFIWRRRARSSARPRVAARLSAAQMTTS
jgi:hypothetical protein